MNIHTAENDEAAQQIIKALALPTASGAPVAPRPLPLSHLPRLPSETSMGYGIGRVDPSGRVTSRGITDAVRWRPGDLLAMTLTPSAVVLCPNSRRAPSGSAQALHRDPRDRPPARQHHPRRRAAPRRGPRIPHRDRAHDAGHGRHARLVLRPDRGGRAFAAMTSSHGTGWSDLDAARLLLEKLGVRPADLVAAPAMVEFPLIADYIPLVEKAVTKGTRRVYGPYWARVVREWGYRRVNEPTALEISQLAEQVRAGAVQRRNARGGRGAAEHLIGALLARRDPETQTIILVLDDHRERRPVRHRRPRRRTRSPHPRSRMVRPEPARRLLRPTQPPGHRRPRDPRSRPAARRRTGLPHRDRARHRVQAARAHPDIPFSRASGRQGDGA